MLKTHPSTNRSVFWVLLILIAVLPGRLLSQRELPNPIQIQEFLDPMPSQYIVGQFYPLGFSPKGNFAYFVEPPDEACGCYFFEFYIQDLITDKILYQFIYNSDIELSKRKVVPENLEALWKWKGEVFKGKMQQYGIEFAHPSFVERDPSGSRGKIGIETDLQLAFDRFYKGDTIIEGAKITASLPNKASKVISSLKFPYESVLKLRSSGYIKSPYENRVALIMVQINRGWEGLPVTVNYQVIGLHLTRGYRSRP